MPSAWLHLSSVGGQTVLPLRVKLQRWALCCCSQKQKCVRMPNRVMSWPSLLQAGGWLLSQRDNPRGEMGRFPRNAGSRQAACQQHSLGRGESCWRWGGPVCWVCTFQGRLTSGSEMFAFSFFLAQHKSAQGRITNILVCLQNSLCPACPGRGISVQPHRAPAPWQGAGTSSGQGRMTPKGKQDKHYSSQPSLSFFFTFWGCF